MGRRKRELDYEVIEKLAAIQCADKEIAAWIGMTPEHFCLRKKKDKELGEAMTRGREKGKISLRRMQWKKAEGGNTAMLIFLGKQYLEQFDRQQFSGDRDKPISLLSMVLPTDEQLAAIALGVVIP